MFREEGKEGKPGQVSMRRVLAFILTLAAIGLFIGGLFVVGQGKLVFIPGIACLASMLVLLFFTTWADITGMVEALKK